jgi:glycosyltransferase involved in cell wall biosynthesis
MTTGVGSRHAEPLVSVVLSVFNGERYLASAMESILSQEDVSLELIAVDDGSTDGSAAILDGYARGDSRLRVLRQPNRGLTQALVRGCAEARGASESMTRTRSACAAGLVK